MVTNSRKRSVGMSCSVKSHSPDSSGNWLAAVLAVAVVLEVGHAQVGTVQRQAQQWGKVSVAW